MASGGESDISDKVIKDTQTQIQTTLKSLWQARKACKSAVTRKENEIHQAMSSFELEDLKLVKDKEQEMIQTMNRFREKHMEYHNMLTSDTDRKESEEYAENMESKYEYLQDKICNFERTIQHRVAESDKLKLGESASGSRKSRRSSVSSALLKAAAEKAALTAEMTFLKKQQELDEMEMKLRQMKEKLRIETEMAKAEAKENILVEAEEKSLVGKLSKSGNRRHIEGATDNIRPTSRDVIASPSHQHPLLEGATDNIRPSSKGDTHMPSLYRQQLEGTTIDIHSPSRHIATSSSLPFPPPEGATSHFYPSVESVIAPRQHPRLPLGGTTADSAHISLPVGGATASVPLHLHQADADVPPGHPDGATVPAGGATASRSTAVHTHTVLNPHAPEWTAHRITPDNSTYLADYGNPPQMHGKDDHLAYILQQGQWQQRQLINAIQIPKVELMMYDGDPLQYWGFIRMFDNSVEKDTVDNSAKLSRLLQYTSGRARAVIQCCAVMNPDMGYQRARQLLQERFGNSFIITETWIDQVTNGPQIKPNERQKLQDFSDELRSCMETLQAMGSSAEINAQSSLVKIIARLPFFMQNKWKQEVRKIRKMQYRNPNISDISSFVLEGAEIANDPVYGGLTDSSSHRTQFRMRSGEKGSNFNFWASQSNNENSTSSNFKDFHYTCLKCGDNHSLFNCSAFKGLKVNERLQFVRDNKLCFNCLKPGHYSNRCGLRRSCSVPGCNKKHTKFLHQLTPSTGQSSSDVESKSETQVKQCAFVENERENFGVSSAVGNLRVALPILPVIVRAPGTQRFIYTYALLDTGSTSTFCSDELVKMLNLTGEKDVLNLTTLEKANSQTETLIVSLQVSDIEDKNVVELPVVYARPQLPVNMSCMGQPEDIGRWKHFQDVTFPHINAHEVQLLIGQDNPDALVPVDLRKGQSGEPYATKTMLGWTLNGPLGGVRRHSATANFVQADHELNAQLRQFWKIDGPEALIEDKKGLSFEDKRVVTLWEESIFHQDDGHYMLPIPFRQHPPSLPENRVMVEQRLESLRRRLIRDSNLHKAYKGFMDDLFDKGYAEKVEAEYVNKVGDKVWYLPHHNVFNPKKPDKVRIVFDCKASHHGVSLNSQVLQGPDLVNSLVGVLLRFREQPVAVMADVEAMYHQVRVPVEDRDVLRFLWWPNGDLEKQPEVYRMTVHLFGGTWSASCCNFALQRTAEDHQQDFDPETVKTVLHDFYVDDCLKSLVNETKAISMVGQLCTLLKRGGFHLTKWLSNCREVLATIPTSDKAKQIKDLDLNFEALPTERALGVYWDIEMDCFKYKITMKEKSLTKRGLLSVVSSVFDPLGFACPVTITAKQILQDLTRAKSGWDEPLSEAVLEKWLCWKHELQDMEKLRIPRCVQSHGQSEIVSIQLHHFSDASMMAYGAVSYLRTTDSTGHIRCFLLMAKSRLSPIKQQTIPRLELTAATLSIRLDFMIRRELSLPVESSTFWTDSMCVMRYVANENRRFHTFVENRVSIIREGSMSSQWRYVDSKSNPADDASRGMSVNDLIANRRWLEGPAFLQQEESAWPQTSDLKQIPDDDPELKQLKSCLVQKGQTTFVMDTLLTRRSTWLNLKKDIAWLLRFKQWLMVKCGKGVTPVLTGPLTVKEMDIAEMNIVKYVQKQEFVKEISELALGKSEVKKTSTIFRLAPVLTTDGVLVVGGRLRNAPIPVSARHQVILPKNHHVVDLIVQDMHVKLAHSGREYVLAELRQWYWIIAARPAVRRVLGKCSRCKRYNAPACEQKMADLPVTRVTPDEPPFTYVGVDYFGTFYVKRARSQVKRYGCWFTCFNTRAIHIEIAHSLDTPSFLNALQRFISRRGQPKEISSDNGTNFIGAERELKGAIDAWNQDQIHAYLQQNGIQWKFNTPTASHMGGVWERPIRTVRKVLRGVMKEQVLDDENLATLMCVVEAIVNGRPLTAVSDDPSDLEALTPNHLLLLRKGPALPPGLFNRDDSYSRRRWRQVQYLANVFWRRWMKEYLPALQSRQKWLAQNRNLAIGDIVLLVSEDTPRSVWPIARIVDTFPGKDGLVRSVQVKTKNSILVRPVNKLCLLEEVH